ncbi:hypothetical protein LOKO_02637 [Halomonas chromatireducens]|uniref:RsdA/BaiN/AoA(So)-like Rossmann fold-like domain-containing protein n=1 Tax=Halomonas chromatireducens TaxID=507626 RepID=A0A120JWC1_9GAMM|nr:hypothetical protein LOKO_02637 [Halomonas chromatireducens]
MGLRSRPGCRNSQLPSERSPSRSIISAVDTAPISSKDFSVEGLPQLRFIGEVLDVTGELGGYNFQWAWASGVACGLSL